MSSTKASALLEALIQRGIQITLDGEDLCVRAPRGVMSTDDWEVVRESKSELLELLRRRHTPTLSFPDYPWRRQVATWPVEWRQRWGEQSNTFELAGLGWLEAEREAFQNVKAEKQAAESPAAAKRKVPI